MPSHFACSSISAAPDWGMCTNVTPSLGDEARRRLSVFLSVIRFSRSASMTPSPFQNEKEPGSFEEL